MRIKAELTPNRSPTCEPFSSCTLAHRHKTLIHCQLWEVSQNHFQICTNTVIHRSIFWPILILKRTHSLSSYIWLLWFPFIYNVIMWYLWSGTFLHMSKGDSYVFYFSIYFRCCLKPNQQTWRSGALRSDYFISGIKELSYVNVGFVSLLTSKPPSLIPNPSNNLTTNNVITHSYIEHTVPGSIQLTGSRLLIKSTQPWEPLNSWQGSPILFRVSSLKLQLSEGKRHTVL